MSRKIMSKTESANLFELCAMLFTPFAIIMFSPLAVDRELISQSCCICVGTLLVAWSTWLPTSLYTETLLQGTACKID